MTFATHLINYAALKVDVTVYPFSKCQTRDQLHVVYKKLRKTSQNTKVDMRYLQVYH